MINYNNELETILDNKEFSVEVKNILLNMLYKINTSYNNYSMVKRNVEDKKIYIEEILQTIENCSNITLMKPSIKENNIYNKFKIDRKNRTIEVYPNEEAMLYALNEYNSNKIYLNENYKLIKNSWAELISKGKNINNIEMIRDFDSWNWNIQIDEIQNMETNLIYQNLLLLLGYKKFNELFNVGLLKSDLELFEKSLTYLYGEENSKRLLYLLYKISIILCVNENANERKNLLNQKKWIEKEYDRLKNKRKLLEDITNSKRTIMNKIKNIDIILNNNSLLFEEYQKRNEKLPEHSKIFSLSQFSEILLRERNKAIENINEYNKLLEPNNYTKIKSKFEKDLNLLSNIKLEGTIKNSTLKLMLNLQEIFLECFSMQVDKAENKKEIMYLIYALRYYNFIPFSKEKYIKDVQELKMKILEIKNMIINKMYIFKVINKNMEMNIVDHIFNTNIMSLENIQFELKNEKNKVTLILYDEEAISEMIEIDENDIDKKKVKFNKKLKLFN